ncbi:MAG: hypothetical protein GQ574_01365 [Crocinitomix sp.]|nr:hypothetical protein [Crocinitomix sp.]
MKINLSLILVLICFNSLSQIADNKLTFSHSSGFYARNFALKITSANGDTIRYTSNGSIPSHNSPDFLDSIPVSILNYLPDTLVYIQTSPGVNQGHTNKYKANIFRFATFKNGFQTSTVYNQSYFVGNEKEELYPNVPVISLITDANNFFQKDTGFYVPGSEYEKNNNSGNYDQKGKNWERPVHLQYFNVDGDYAFGQDIGARIHGRIRRIPQKSLRICARSEYGNATMNYPFFGSQNDSTFKKILLRNSMGCWQKTLFKDQLTSYLCRDLNFEIAAGQPVIVFLNGEYWGIHAIREYFNDDYFSDKLLVPKDSINLVKHDFGVSQGSNSKRDVDEGSGKGLIDLYAFLTKADMQLESNYEAVQKWLDLSSIIDYYCAEIFFNNRDWPNNNNVLWSVGKNGHWRQIFSDLDAGWSKPEANTLALLLRKPNSSAKFLFQKLMESAKFKTQFSQRMSCLLQNELSEKNILTAIDLYEKLYEPIVQEHIYRWGIPGSINQWKGKVDLLRSFAKNRGQNIMRDFKAVFDQNFNSDLTDC